MADLILLERWPDASTAYTDRPWAGAVMQYGSHYLELTCYTNYGTNYGEEKMRRCLIAIRAFVTRRRNGKGRMELFGAAPLPDGIPASVIVPEDGDREAAFGRFLADPWAHFAKEIL